MISAAPLSATERLARIIDGLRRAVAARGVGGRLTSALLILLWNRLGRAAIRVRRLGERIAAGASLNPRQRPTVPRPARPQPPPLPRGTAWLVRLAVPGVAACGSQLQFLLAEPEMAALAATPAMRRIVRPLCRMLGVPPPPLPARPSAATRPRQAADATRPRPCPPPHGVGAQPARLAPATRPRPARRDPVPA